MNDLSAKLKIARKRIQHLRNENQRLKWALQEAFSDPDIIWLYANRQERMDASSNLFESGRAAFHKDRYEFASTFAKDKQVLDAACGTGYGVKLLADASAKTVTGIDIEPDCIQYAQKKYGQDNILFKQATVTNLPFSDNSFDIITSFETIEHLENDLVVIEEFSRVLKDKGLLIISTPNEWPLEIAPFHKHVYNKHQFSQLISTHFNIIKFLNQNSGTDFKYNHSQPRNIQPTVPKNEHLAECYIVVATKL